MRLGVGDKSTLVQPRNQNGSGRRFCETTKIVARECNRAPRTHKRLFLSGEIRRSASNGRQPGKGNRTGGYGSSTASYLQPKSISNLIPAGFMQLDQYILIGLIGDRPPGVNALPIKYSQVVQPALAC